MNFDLCTAASPFDPGDDDFRTPMTRTPVPQTRADDGLLTMVDFKWLMAGLGWRVDLTRMRRDAAYLGECAQRGLASESTLLRKRSVDLLRLQSVRKAAAAVHARGPAAKQVDAAFMRANAAHTRDGRELPQRCEFPVRAAA